MSYKIKLNDKATIDDIRAVINMMDLVHNGFDVEQIELLKSREGVDLTEAVPRTLFLNDPVAFPQTLVINDTENEATID